MSEKKQHTPERQAIIDKAKATKQRNLLAKGLFSDTQTSQKVEAPKSDCCGASDEQKVWLQALLTIMTIRDVKTSLQLEGCIPVAEDVLKAYKARFK